MYEISTETLNYITRWVSKFRNDVPCKLKRENNRRRPRGPYHARARIYIGRPWRVTMVRGNHGA